MVTGAGRGMGREIPLKLSDEGANMVIHYASSKSGAEETASLCRDKGVSAVACQADIADRNEVQELFAAIDENPGPKSWITGTHILANGGANT